jgi:tRNA threonylcarbamoyladenosine biosynthesis protein TsaB
VILALKTANPIVEIYLLNDNNPAGSELAKKSVKNAKKWEAGRTLAKNLLGEIEQLLARTELIKNWENLTGIIVFRGPGSFTGLRIGITTANTLAYAQQIPIVGTTGDNWLANGLASLAKKQNDKIVLPEYGALPNITISKLR